MTASVSGTINRQVRDVALALVLVFGAITATGDQLVAQSKPTPAEAARELLLDGLDALRDQQTGLAKQLFETLQKTYPGTAEAGRAGLELEALHERASNSNVPQTTLRFNSARTSKLDALRRKFLIDVGDRVFFAENSDKVGGRARAMLDQQARWIKGQRGIAVTLIGRADDGGSPADALALSGARAEAVRQRFLAAGIPDDKIFIDARGDRDPLAICGSAVCRAQNRHTESLIGYAQQASDARP